MLWNPMTNIGGQINYFIKNKVECVEYDLSVF